VSVVEDLARVLGEQLAGDEQLGLRAGLGGELPAVGRVVAEGLVALAAPLRAGDHHHVRDLRVLGLDGAPGGLERGDDPGAGVHESLGHLALLPT
jgi:hypothetical protein